MTSTLLDQILKAAQLGESEDWEFKSARGGFPGSFWETYSAMSNTEGGTILLGARESRGSISLEGLTDEQLRDYQKNLWDNLNNRNKVNRNLVNQSAVKVFEISEAKLLSIQVRRATRSERPIYIGPTPFGNTYRRQYEGDYRCTDDEVRRMLADADPIPADQRILEGFSLDDLDSPSLTQYRQRFRAAKGEHAWLALEDRNLLEHLNGWRRDRETGKEGFTLAGLLMFGKDRAIRDPAAAPNYFVDYREKLDPKIRWTDRVYPDGNWEANLFQFYQRVWPKLSAGLPIPFQLEGVMRRDETPVHEALREAFVNALIHADYSAPGGVVIERHPDQFILENPGTILVSHEQYLKGGVSECRNKALQKMFLMIGGGEQAGSGVDKIRAGWRSQHWRAPKIGVRPQPDRVTLTLPMVSLIPDSTMERLRNLFGIRLDGLTGSEIQALATANLEEGVSNVRLQELVADHPADITRILQKLCDQGFLVSDHRRRWAIYRLPHYKEGSSSPLQADSSSLAINSSPLAGDSLPLLDEELQKLASFVATKKKVPPDAMQSTIAQLCKGRYLSAEQLGKYLHRNSSRLRNHFLTPLVQKRVLRLRYPESPNRPDQSYTAT